jgi:hypothetical protein
LLWLAGCAAEVTSAEAPAAAGRERPDILLISIDTLRADRLGCYGRDGARTPAIDALAAEAVVFDAAYTTAPITLPAHASMLTGLIPPRHGVRDNGAFRLPDSVTTLAETLSGQGYRTAAFIGGLPLLRSGGLAQGFERYDDDIAARSLGGSTLARRHERYAEEVLGLAQDWLRAAGPEPVFAFIHLYDPHSPYERALPGTIEPSYDGELAYVDGALGRFRAVLGADPRFRSALTVVTSDHGEGLGDHDERTHCVFVYDSTLRVPLLVHWPGALGPRRVADPVGLVDLVPTLLDLAGLPPLTGLDGVSLEEQVRRGSPAERRDLYFESLFGELRFGWAPLRGVRRGTAKYISAPRPELYDLGNDPDERHNRWPDAADEVADLEERLNEVGEGTASRIALDEDTARALRSLGYVSASPVGTAGAEDPLDPKDQIRVYEEFQRAHEEALAGRLEETLAILARVEPSLHRSPYFYLEWGNFAAHAERWPLAITCYEKCLALDESNSDALLNLGVAFIKTASPDRARAPLEALLALDPNHVEGHLYYGVILYRNFRDLEGARRQFTRFLELAPDHASAPEIRRVLAEMPP